MLGHRLLSYAGSFLLLGLLFSTVDAAAMSYGDAINKAGRQRMLSQRIVKSYTQMGQDVRYRVAEKQLKESIALFDKRWLSSNPLTRTAKPVGPCC